MSEHILFSSFPQSLTITLESNCTDCQITAEDMGLAPHKLDPSKETLCTPGEIVLRALFCERYRKTKPDEAPTPQRLELSYHGRSQEKQPEKEPITTKFPENVAIVIENDGRCIFKSSVANSSQLPQLPAWVGSILNSKAFRRKSDTIGFLLSTAESKIDVPTRRLAAPGSTKVRRISQFIVERNRQVLERLPEDLDERLQIMQDYYLVSCNDKELSIYMNLLTIKSTIWKKSADIKLQLSVNPKYKSLMKSSK